MSPTPPRFSWEEQKSKNIEINQDINCAWKLFFDCQKDQDAFSAIDLDQVFWDCFDKVRELNERARKQERDKLLQEHS